MNILAAIKKYINSNLEIPLNEQLKIPRILIYNASGTFIAPNTAYYLITCIGKGGNGGTAQANSSYTPAFGGGGGGGAKYDSDSRPSYGYGGGGGAGAVIIEYFE